MALSACWIVKNESAVLARSIQSVKNAVDEMIVVDTGSTDDTVQIAQSLGARVEHFTWINDFSAARNYALSLTKNKNIIFLDADEWFEPALSAADGLYYDNLLLSDPKLDVISVEIVHINADQKEFERNQTTRILAKKPDLAYSGSVHELYCHAGNRAQALIGPSMKNHVVMHSGYAREYMEKKLERNLELLLEEAQRQQHDPPLLFITHIYIVREYVHSGKIDEAVPHVQYILDHAHLIGDVKARITSEPGMFRVALECGLFFGKLSRRQIKSKFFEALERLYPHYPGAPLLMPYYHIRFAPHDGALLGEIDEVSQRVRSLEPSPHSEYRRMEGALCGAAALAAFHRGDPLRMLDYAVGAIRKGVYTTTLVYVVLQAVRGQPPAEIVAFLNQIMGTEEKHKIESLVEFTRLDGFLPVHVYYLRRLKAMVGEDSILDMNMLLYSKMYEEAMSVALAIMEQAGANTMHYALTALLCMGDPNGVERYASAIPPFLRVARAYFAGERLEDLTVEETAVYPSVYPALALTEGLEAADRFAAVYASNPKLVFEQRAKYLTDNGLFERLLDSIPGEIDLTAMENCVYVYMSQIHCGRYEEAYEHIRYFLAEQKSIDNNLFSNLLVIAEKADEPLSSQAYALYERHKVYADALIDLGDVAKFGYAEDDCSHAETKKLASLTSEEFEKIMREEDEGRFVSEELFEACEKAGPVFEQKRMFGMAIRCYRLPYCHNHNRLQNAENLARSFRGARNRRLARWFEEQYAEGRGEA